MRAIIVARQQGKSLFLTRPSPVMMRLRKVFSGAGCPAAVMAGRIRETAKHNRNLSRQVKQ